MGQVPPFSPPWWIHSIPWVAVVCVCEGVGEVGELGEILIKLRRLNWNWTDFFEEGDQRSSDSSCNSSWQFALQPDL